VGDTQREQAEQFRVAIEGERYYRMRHIHEMRLQCESQLMELPAFSNPSICVAPDDILLRRVGKTASAMVSQYHRRHPADANLAIIRGLKSRQATWLAFCLNQPLYKSYLEQQVGTASLVRVGLKHLAKMPVAPCPEAFYTLADQYQQYYQTLVRSEDFLFTLRKKVQDWLKQRLPEDEPNKEQTVRQRTQLSARFFKARDLGEQLNYATAEQSRLAHRLTDEFDCVPLAKLADINPRLTNSVKPQHQATNPDIIKIKHLDGQQSIMKPEKTGAGTGWRVHTRPLSRFDVLISTFVQEPKVAIVFREPETMTLVSEQLAVLNFHHSPGAYALLMEAPLIRQQISWLATGTVQRFVQSKILAHLVLPKIDRELAMQWHQQLLELLETKADASKRLDELYLKMFQVYRRVHPDTNNSRGYGQSVQEPSAKGAIRQKNKR